MPDSDNIVERISRFLEQQREVYGDFSVDISSADTSSESPESSEQEQASASSQDQVEESQVAYQEQGSEKKDQPEKDQTMTMTTPEEQIRNCSTLEELRELCEQAETLKTDLPNTNLVFGVGNPDADLMIIGEAPGENEDIQGEPFVGKAGQLLDKIMAAINFDRSDIYIANILKHRPPNNRNPLPEERERSLPYLLRQIELVDPKIILCVGKVSGTTLLDKDVTLGSMRQKVHEFKGRELMVTYHPAALLRNPQWKRPTWEDVQMLRKRYDELGGQP